MGWMDLSSLCTAADPRKRSRYSSYLFASAFYPLLSSSPLLSIWVKIPRGRKKKRGDSRAQDQGDLTWRRRGMESGCRTARSEANRDRSAVGDPEPVLAGADSSNCGFLCLPPLNRLPAVGSLHPTRANEEWLQMGRGKEAYSSSS